MSFVPFLTEPYPNEMLYSWIYRMADQNALSISVFGKEYLQQKGIYSGELPYDIRHEYVYLCQHFVEEPDYAKLYMAHSPFRFDSLFHTKFFNIRMANSIALHADSLNPTLQKGIRHVCICPECAREDRSKYGTPYLHVNHNIGDSHLCKKHSVSLMRYNGKNHRLGEYDINQFSPVIDKGEPKLDLEYAYSAFVEDIYTSEISGSVEDLKRAATIRMSECGYSLHGDGYYAMENDYQHSEYSKISDKTLRYCFDRYMLHKKSYGCREFIPLLMFLFGTVDNMAKYIEKTEPLLKNSVCTKCQRLYISCYDERYSMGVCPDCYSEIPINIRLHNLVNISNDGGYHALSPFKSMNSRIDIQHSCGMFFSTIPRNMIYGHTKCRCEQNYDDIWYKHLGELEEYKRVHGTTNVPKRYEIANFKLGYWCQKLRSDKMNGILPIDRELALLELGFDFAPNDTAWENNYELYKEYAQLSGDIYVMKNTIYKDVRIGEWYANNRNKCLKGKMSQTQIEKLRAVNPDFPKRPERPIKEEKPHKRIVRFDEAVEMLLRYAKEHGTMNIPKQCIYEGYKLGIWANQMRSKKRQGILPEKQIRTLNAIGFDWSPLQTKWNTDIARYRDYVGETSKLEVPKEAVYNGFSIGYWYSNLKVSRKNNSLSPDQVSDIIRINPYFMSQDTRIV